MKQDISTFLRKLTLAREFSLILLVIAFIFIGFLIDGWIGGLAGFGIGAIILLLFEVLGGRSRIIIQEREIGVLFDHRGNFDRLLPPGVYDIWRKELKVRLPSHKLRASDRLDNVRTREGIQVSVNWTTEYFINTEALLSMQSNINNLNPAAAEEAREELRNMVYPLLNLPPGKVKGLTMGVIKFVLETKKIEELYLFQQNGDDGVLKTLEDEITEKVKALLTTMPYTEESGKVRLGPITMPMEIEKALETAHERKLYTDAVSGSLRKLSEAIDNIKDEQVRRLADLERLRIMAQRGGSYSYQNQENYAEVKVNTGRNGRSSSPRRKRGDNKS